MQTSRKTPLFPLRDSPDDIVILTLWAGSKADADGQFCCDDIPLHLPCLNFHSYNLLLIYHEKNIHLILFSSRSTHLSLWLSLFESSSHAKAPSTHADPITIQARITDPISLGKLLQLSAWSAWTQDGNRGPQRWCKEINDFVKSLHEFSFLCSWLWQIDSNPQKGLLGFAGLCAWVSRRNWDCAWAQSEISAE